MTSGLRDAGTAMIGRRQERERIERLLDSGGRLLLVGDAGIGKTTLWEAAVELARERGCRLLCAAPAQAEHAFTFAVIGDLLGRVFDEIADALPLPQRRALARALLRIDDPGDREVDVHTVGVAVHTALGVLGRTAPVVVAIDDVQWIDAASAAALDFALRRVEPLRCLLALRRGTTTSLELGADRFEIGPLSVGALHHLLVERFGVALPRPALLRVHELSGGNPFYAIELARGVGEGEDVVLPASLAELVADRVRALPGPTRRELAKLALAGTADDNAELSPAFAAGVLVPAEGGGRFSHPLLAEAAVEMLSPEERSALHRQIAATVDDPGLRARHLALAVSTPDEKTASLVAEAASFSAPSRIAAAELWEHAARLTPPDHEQARVQRLCEAGIAHILTGNPDYGASLLTSNLDRLPPGPLRHRAAGHLALMRGREDITLTVDDLSATLAEIDDPRAASAMVGMLCGTIAATGDVERASRVADEHLALVERAADDRSTLARALTTAAVYRFTLERPAWDLLERARALDPGVVERGEIFAHQRDGRIDEARIALERTLAHADRQTIFEYHAGVSNLALTELAAGRWELAEAYADEALTIGEQIGAPFMVCIGLTCSATVDAVCGRVDAARGKLRRALDEAERINAALHADYARFILGLVELSLGRYEEASATYRDVSKARWTHLGWCVGGRPALDAVEALTATGDLEAAREISSHLAPDAREQFPVRACLEAASGDPEKAVELLGAAEPAPAPFRAARELLLRGRFLRQARRRTEAREALEGARRAFEQIGALVWAGRCEDELGRLGGRSPAGATLTASERRVAELVAEGLSNKEVARRLVVTVRTVEAHLSKVYAKLGVRSRTELAAAWRRQASG